MTYSCTDFTDTVLDALKIVVPEEDYDDPSAQADLVLGKLAAMQRRIDVIPDLLAALKEAEREIHNPGAGNASGVDVAEMVRAALAKAEG